MNSNIDNENFDFYGTHYLSSFITINKIHYFLKYLF